MKYVIINGSPRKKNTWAVVKQVKESLNGDFEEIHLMKEKIPLCVGCFNCICNGEESCPHYENVHPIVEKINEADAIIIASPVYALNVTALLKNLFDHTAYLYHRPEFFTKKALVVVTTAGAGHNDTAKYMDETLRHWGVNKVYKLAFKCGGKDGVDKKPVDKVAQKFARDVESGRLHSPKLGDIIFYEVWRTMSIQGHIPQDKKYWQETRLIDHDFAPEVKLGIFKGIFAKLMFAVLKKVM